LLYDQELGRLAYQRWLRSLGVEYVVLSEAPPDYSSRAEARLLRSGASGLRAVLYSPRLTVYELPHATRVVTGPVAANVTAMDATRLTLRVAGAGRYRVGVKFSPYWRTLLVCVFRAADGMTRVTAFHAGRVALEFSVNV